MKIEKAIKILSKQPYPHIIRYDPDFRQALELSIEALKRLEEIRRYPGVDADIPLPGETKD